MKRRKRVKLSKPPAGMWSRVWYLNRARPSRKRVDIPEGASAHEIPADGHGRIMGVFARGERYATTCKDGWRLFVAWGKYDALGSSPNARIRRRHWFAQLNHRIEP